MKMYEVSNRYQNTLKYSITLPANDTEYQLYKDKKLFKLSGKTIQILGKDKYITGNALELEFLRKLSGIIVSDMGTEVKEEIIKLGPTPTIKTILTKEEANQFKYKDLSEEIVLDNLIELGYLSKDSTSGLLECTEAGEIKVLDEKAMVTRLKELGWVLYKKSHLTGEDKKKNGK